MASPLAVGLVGAGPWARFAHAPMLAAGPETTLAGVWARRPEAAAEVAGDHEGVVAFDRYEDLLEGCEAVAFAVPPDAQVEMATVAARAGKAVLLEKPIALDLHGARLLADAVGEAGVGSLVVLSYRFAQPVRAFVEQARRTHAVGGRAAFISGAATEGLFASSPWRQASDGALLDLGPHAVDLLDACLGPVEEVEARASTDRRWVGLLLGHQGGLASQVALSSATPVEPARFTVEVVGPEGLAELDAMGSVGPGAFAAVRARFAEVARTGGQGGAPGGAGAESHDLDVHRGLHLQEVLEQARGALADGG